MSEPATEPLAKFAVPPGIYARPFGEELIVLQFASGEYFGLDAIGAEVWRSVERGDALGIIAARIATIWEVDESLAFRDIAVLVRDLCDCGLLAPR